MKDFLLSRKVLVVVSLICLALLIRGLYWLLNDWSPEAQIARYRLADLIGDQLPARGLALGSSTIRWMPSTAFCGPWHNRGIGNATTADISAYVQGGPKMHWDHVLLYTGENDLAFGGSQERVRQNVVNLLQEIKERYSPSTIYLLAVKLSPARQAFGAEYSRLNNWLSEYLKTVPDVVFLDHRLSDETATLYGEAYQSDRIHLSAKGYQMFLTPLKERCAEGE